MGSDKVVLRYADVELIESPDGMMRDTILVTDESCGSKSVSAGLVWVHPHGEIHEDTHEFDELYYVIRGDALVIMDGKEVPATAGDIVFLRAGVSHRIANPNDETFQIVWVISTAWSDMTAAQAELNTWPRVNPAEGWHLT
jgi:mannose-6-phosphate isomerase-like protein (cupin superfamily)